MRGRVLVVLLLVAAACSSAPSQRRAASIVVGTTDTVTNLDPASCYDYFCSRVVLANTHEGLVRFAPGSATPAPALAESWSVSDDGLTYTFTMRANAHFHDGTPVTSEIVKSSLDRVKNLLTPETGGFLLYDTVNDPPRSGIVEIRTPAPLTLIIRLGKRDATFLRKLEFQTASAVPPGPYPTDSQAQEGVISGTGPYKLAVDGYVRGDHIDLVRNDEYWGPAPLTRRVRIRFFKSSSELVGAVRSGTVDVAYRSLSPDEVADVAVKKTQRVVTGPGAAIRFLAFNVSRDPFKNVEIRRGIAAAMDRQRFPSELFKSTVEPLYSLVPTAFAEHKDVFSGTGGAAAVAPHLDAAGLPPGQKVAAELWYTPAHYGDTEQKAAEILKDTLEKTERFTITLRSSEWAGYKSSLARGEFGMYMLGWYPDYLDPDDYLAPFLGTAGAHALGSNYSSPEVDAMLDEERATADDGKRTDVIGRIQDKLAADVPYVPLWQAKQVAITGSRVRGVTLDASQTLRFSSIEKGA